MKKNISEITSDFKALIGFKLEEIEWDDDELDLYFRKKEETAIVRVAYPEITWNT